MFILPLVGWGMLSAARYPIVLFGFLHLFVRDGILKRMAPWNIRSSEPASSRG